MIKKLIYILILLGTALTGSCTDDAAPANQLASEETSVHFSVGVSSMEGDVDTRSTDTLTVNEKRISNLWVLQFQNEVLVKKVYTDTVNVSDVVIPLVLGESNVYFVANVPSGTFDAYTVGTTTEATFKTAKLTPGSENTMLYTPTTGKKCIPMYGELAVSIPASGYVPVQKIMLTRLLARVDFTWSVGENMTSAITLTHLQVRNVSNVVQYYPSQSALFPEVPTVIHYSEIATDNSGGMLTFYLPENKRGSGMFGATYFLLSGIVSGNAHEILYTVYPGENYLNDYNIKRNYSYKVKAKIIGLDTADDRVEIYSNSAIDLSAAETANCYIAPAAKTFYKFNAGVRGNGAITPQSICGTQTAPAIVPDGLSPDSVFVVWETGSRNSVVDSLFLGTDGYVRFRTANNSTNGNALIAVTDNNDNIIWSWHIWKVNYNPGTTYDTYKKYGSTTTFKMMKYNLGATNITNWSGSATVPGNMGLRYQWGRKDPFLGVVTWAEGANRIASANAAGYAWADGRSSTSIIANTVAGSNADETITYAIEHPTYGIGAQSTTKDWLAAVSYTNQCNNLWGNPNTGTTIPNPAAGNKSIYDPCPPGWRVPTHDSFRIFTSNGQSQTGSESNLNISGEYAYGYTFFITAWRTGATSYWPASEYMPNTSGDIKLRCNYWSSSSYASNNSNSGILDFIQSYVYPLSSSGRASPMPIRCARY